MKIIVKMLSEHATIPKFNHTSDAGMDLYSAEEAIIPVKERYLVKTNIAVQVDEELNPFQKFFYWLFDIKYKYYFKVEDTSGNAYKKGTRTMAGIIDETYRGDIGVIIYNTSNVPIIINKHDKIAQMILHKVPFVDRIVLGEVSDTERGSKGFGSSGSIGDKK